MRAYQILQISAGRHWMPEYRRSFALSEGNILQILGESFNIEEMDAVNV